MYILRRSIDNQGAGGLSPMSSSPPPAISGGGSSWPGVIGTISIILAALGIMCWGCNSGSSILNMVAPDMMMNQMEMTEVAGDSETGSTDVEKSSGDQSDIDSISINGMASFSPAMKVVDIIVNFASLGMSIWLLCAGIGLTRRRPWSVGSLQAWSWIRILVALGWFLMMFWMMQGPMMDDLVAQLQEESSKQGDGVEFDAQIMRWIVIGSCALVGLVLIAWPVFLLFYLGRRRVSEEVAGWNSDVLPSSDWGGE